MLRDCITIAVEGTHASGKTTLTHAPSGDNSRRQTALAVLDRFTRWRR